MKQPFSCCSTDRFNRNIKRRLRAKVLFAFCTCMSLARHRAACDKGRYRHALVVVAVRATQEDAAFGCSVHAGLHFVVICVHSAGLSCRLCLQLRGPWLDLGQVASHCFGMRTRCQHRNSYAAALSALAYPAPCTLLRPHIAPAPWSLGFRSRHHSELPRSARQRLFLRDAIALALGNG